MSPKNSALLLKLASIGLLAFAVVFATGSYSAIDAPAQFVLDLLDWPLDGNHAEISRDMRWMLAVASGFLMIISITNIWIIAPLLEQGNRSVARVSFYATLVWAVVDCAGSYAAGVGSNSLWNVGFAIPFLAAYGLMNPEKS